MDHPALILFLILLIAICGYALWKGGAPERWTACLFVVAPVLTYLAASPLQARYRNIELGILTVDTMMFAVLLGLALKAYRTWPIWMAALQAVVVLSHFAILLDPQRVRFTGYWVVEARVSYAMIFLLGLATYLHRRRVRTFGHDPSWRG